MHSHLISRLPRAYENALCFFNHFHTNIYKMHIFSISSPMAYTHNYIPYNCDIMLTHQAYALTYYFQSTQAIHFINFKHTKHGRFWSNSSQPGTVFNSPKNRTVGCLWAAHSLNVGSSWWNRIPYLFPVSYSPKHNLLYKL